MSTRALATQSVQPPTSLLDVLKTVKSALARRKKDVWQKRFVTATAARIENEFMRPILAADDDELDALLDDLAFPYVVLSLDVFAFLQRLGDARLLAKGQEASRKSLKAAVKAIARAEPQAAGSWSLVFKIFDAWQLLLQAVDDSELNASVEQLAQSHIDDATREFLRRHGRFCLLLTVCGEELRRGNRNDALLAKLRDSALWEASLVRVWLPEGSARALFPEMSDEESDELLARFRAQRDTNP